MRLPFSLVLLPGVLSAAGPGWIDMLPGPNVSGWTRIAIPPDKPVNEKQQWSVDSTNHTLICTGDQGHEWLRYDARQFENFEYHIEWQFTPVDTLNPRYNSGVFFRNDKDGTIWHQAQTDSGSGGYIFGDTLINGELKRINLSKERKGKFEKPAGEWNVYDIKCEGKHCTLTVNGELSSEGDFDVPKGYLGLESEGYKITFRDIRVKPLP
ncbi:MAG TPA: DUF1080 domain-containing protein [Bryobacteraceae bacterium]